MQFPKSLALVFLTACSGGQSGTDQWDVERATNQEPDAAPSEPTPTVGEQPAADGGTPEPNVTGQPEDGPSQPLPDCALTDIAVEGAEEPTRWAFSACLVAPDRELNGELDLLLEGEVTSTTVMSIRDWIPEGGCPRNDAHKLLIGAPLADYAGNEDVRVGSVLGLTTTEGDEVELVIAAPESCFDLNPNLDRPTSWGQCPLWSYRIAEGSRVALQLSSEPGDGLPSVSLELLSEEGKREMWLQQARSADELSMSGVTEAALGAAECEQQSECGQPEVQRMLDLTIDASAISLGVGATTVIDDYWLLNARTTSAAQDSCSAATSGSVVASWPACTEVVQDVAGRLESAGYTSCPGDIFPSRYVVTERPEACASLSYPDYSTRCDGDEACGDDTCENNSYCRRPSVCITDADCGAGQICVCAGSYGGSEYGGLTGNVCVTAECESADDCAGLPCAIGYDGFWGGSVDGAFCHQPEDECSSAADCPSNEYCRHSAAEGRWICEGIVVQ